MRLSALLAAVNTVVVHWCNRVVYCPRGEHRHTVRTFYGHLYWVCVDCQRREELGPVYLHGSNRKTRRSA
jgi:hypothetical protein